MKKAIISIIIAAILLCCILMYFAPLSLSNTVSQGSKIDITLNEFQIENGAPDIHTVVYQDITDEQKSDILDILEQFPYRRTLSTPFSTGSMTELGEHRLLVYVYRNDELSDSVVITSSGQIAVNDRHYYMKNAEQLIEQIIEIVE